MSRVYNFSAGPAVLPEEVLKEAADEMLDYRGSGMSVMEMSHRSKVFDNIIKEAEAGSERSDEHSGQLQSSVFTGRRIPAVCHDPDEPDEEPRGRLYRHRPVGEESLSGSTDLRQGSKALHPPRIRRFPISRIVPICRYHEDAGLCVHLRE